MSIAEELQPVIDMYDERGSHAAKSSVVSLVSCLALQHIESTDKVIDTVDTFFTYSSFATGCLGLVLSGLALRDRVKVSNYISRNS